MFLKKLILSVATGCLLSSVAFATNCGPSGQSIRILASDFPAIHAVAGTAEKIVHLALQNSHAIILLRHARL